MPYKVKVTGGWTQIFMIGLEGKFLYGITCKINEREPPLDSNPVNQTFTAEIKSKGPCIFSETGQPHIIFFNRKDIKEHLISGIYQGK
jgi:hypothetical protein